MLNKELSERLPKTINNPRLKIPTKACQGSMKTLSLTTNTILRLPAQKWTLLVSIQPNVHTRRKVRFFE